MERTRVILVLIESFNPNPLTTFNQLKNELQQFNPDLLEKKRLILRTKMDLVSGHQLTKEWDDILDPKVDISSVTRDGLAALVNSIAKMINED